MVKDTELYDVLEVAPNCSEGDLKKSYRRLCLIHHPDKQQQPDPKAHGSGATPAAADSTKFQAIQNAYEILSDGEKRREYDLYGQKGARGGGGRGGYDEEDMDDLFSSFFGGERNTGPAGGGRAPRPRPQPKTQTKPSVVSLQVTLEELYNGKEKKLEVERTRTCASCGGSGAKPKTKPRPCVKCGGQGGIYILRQVGPYATRVPIACPSCDGAGTKVRAQDACKKCHGIRTVSEKKRVEVFVERGMYPGETIVIKGEGDESPDSSSPGDLHITLLPLPHSSFTLSPSHPPSSSFASHAPPLRLHTTLSLTLSESLLGFSRLVLVHLDGRGLRVHQPAPGEKGWRVLKTGDKVVVRGEGMERRGDRADLVLTVEVEMPGEDWAFGLGAEKIKALEALLPPKRMDVKNPTETDEVSLDEYSEVPPDQDSHGRSSQKRPTDTDDEDEGRPSCHQQ